VWLTGEFLQSGDAGAIDGSRGGKAFGEKIVKVGGEL
jgi:hypothetical protein